MDEQTLKDLKQLATLNKEVANTTVVAIYAAMASGVIDPATLRDLAQRASSFAMYARALAEIKEAEKELGE